MKKIIYIVVPCYNEEEVIEETAKRLSEILNELIHKDKISVDSRICFVNDGSKDNTWNKLKRFCLEDNNFVGINLSKNFGHQNALLAGLNYSRQYCDATITIDADLQQDISKIEEFIDKFYEGNEIVYGVRNSRDTDSFFKKFTAITFYKLMNCFGCNVLQNHADYRLLSSKVVNELMKFTEVNLFLRGLIPLIGYKSDVIYFDVFERFAGTSKYSISKMMGFAINGITSLTIKPVRMITLLGIFIFIISLIVSIYFLIAKITGATVPGWTTIAMSVWMIGGIQLLSIGIVGEYIGKIYMETKHRPRFIIEEVLEKKI